MRAKTTKYLYDLAFLIILLDSLIMRYRYIIFKFNIFVN
jgi:hypothetical protein